MCFKTDFPLSTVWCIRLRAELLSSSFFCFRPVIRVSDRSDDDQMFTGSNPRRNSRALEEKPLKADRLLEIQSDPVTG